MIRCYVEINGSQWGVFCRRLEEHAHIEYEKRRLAGDRFRVTMRSRQFPQQWEGQTLDIVQDDTHKSGIRFALRARKRQ